MKFIHLTLLFLVFLLLRYDCVFGQSYMSEEGYVEFISRAPLLEFKGKSDHLTGLIDLDQNLIDFYVDLNTIDTGIQRRNRDMRSTYLKTDTFPFADFSGKLLTEFDPESEGEQRVKTRGIFTIHGVEREIDVEGTLEPRNGGLKLNASWTILLDDYNIERPRVLFYELADEQVVNISVLLSPRIN